MGLEESQEEEPSCELHQVEHAPSTQLLVEAVHWLLPFSFPVHCLPKKKKKRPNSQQKQNFFHKYFDDQHLFDILSFILSLNHLFCHLTT